MKKAENLILDLCEEIDYWKSEAKYYKEQYEIANRDFHEATTRSINHNMDMVGQMLKIVINSEPTEKGLLIKHVDESNE